MQENMENLKKAMEQMEIDKLALGESNQKKDKT